MREAILAAFGLCLIALIACAGGDLPAPSAPTDPANPRGPVTPFEVGQNPLAKDLPAAPASSGDPMPAGNAHGDHGAMPMNMPMPMPSSSSAMPVNMPMPATTSAPAPAPAPATSRPNGK